MTVTCSGCDTATVTAVVVELSVSTVTARRESGSRLMSLLALLFVAQIVLSVTSSFKMSIR